MNTRLAGVCLVASGGNDHRLGANEALPAIMSVFLGDPLTDVFEQIKASGVRTSVEKGTLESRLLRQLATADLLVVDEQN